jgi:hypothetical protein
MPSLQAKSRHFAAEPIIPSRGLSKMLAEEILGRLLPNKIAESQA